MKKILIINGPNLNMLGARQPEIYGSKTLDDVRAECEALAKQLGLEIDFRQSNLEGDLISWIQDSPKKFQGIIINAGAYTHTSIGIRDALLTANIQAIEVHISNIFKREDFRHHSYISDVAVGMICGLGTEGYGLAMRAMTNLNIGD